MMDTSAFPIVRPTSHFPLPASARLPARRAGFTLVELAMTALLLSIGLLSVFALLRRGIASRMEMEGEVRAASFADTAFHTLRAWSDHIAISTNALDWGSFWIAFQGGETNLPLPGIAEREPLNPKVRHTGSLYGTGYHYSYSNQTVRVPITYRCFVEATNSFAGELEVFVNYPTNRAQVTLHVWPSLATNQSPQTFFTLFSNPGRLP